MLPSPSPTCTGGGAGSRKPFASSSRSSSSSPATGRRAASSIGSLLQIGRTEQALRELDTLLNESGPVPERARSARSCGAENQDTWVRCERCSAWLPPAQPVPLPRARPVPAPPAD